MQCNRYAVENPLRILMYPTNERELRLRRLPWSALAAQEMAGWQANLKRVIGQIS